MYTSNTSEFATACALWGKELIYQKSGPAGTTCENRNLKIQLKPHTGICQYAHSEKPPGLLEILLLKPDNLPA